MFSALASMPSTDSVALPRAFPLFFCVKKSSPSRKTPIPCVNSDRYSYSMSSDAHGPCSSPVVIHCEAVLADGQALSCHNVPFDILTAACRIDSLAPQSSVVTGVCFGKEDLKQPPSIAKSHRFQNISSLFARRKTPLGNTETGRSLRSRPSFSTRRRA
ncbi:unnamed protein product [Mycena citricolor]|uniref:Uncharacterized protein n=1 Tax=Mycena citricolor TaxID=2018698 RepID=A0AAD2GTR9_9AGAR|nr:unnamed protein product [Mycena citricolor]